jgi:hypothetical protein
MHTKFRSEILIRTNKLRGSEAQTMLLIWILKKEEFYEYGPKSLRAG